ncbi:MAG: hypothetical protein IKW60_03770 [Clostridia bacterium]|nr:hypothetical protein [Clostridia bacterium]
MNLDEMLKRVNGNNLQQAMEQMGKLLTPQQMQTVQQMLNGNQGQVKEKLNQVNAEAFQQELRKNPKLAAQLANNPEIMQKINQLLGK